MTLLNNCLNALAVLTILSVIGYFGFDLVNTYEVNATHLTIGSIFAVIAGFTIRELA